MAADDRETLRFNPSNAVTDTVERIRSADGTSLVLKRLRRAGTVSEGPAHWAASAERSAWNYWAREAEVYADPRLRASLADTGLALARLTGDTATARQATGAPHTPGDTVDLLLEDVAGTPGTAFALDDHVAFAAGLGRWQAQPPDPSPEWASRGFLREYASTRPTDFTLLDDEAAWAQPLIRDTWPDGLRDGWKHLVDRRAELFDVMEQLPRTLCHLDAWAANVIRRPSGEVVLLDWAFAGDGAVGEDLGNHLPDTVFDLFWPAARLAELEAACWPAYLAGLRERGWSGSGRDARLGVVAACVKYIWLLPRLLAGASRTEQSAYHRPADAEHLFRERGIALAHLVGWSEEAFATLA